MVRLLTTTLLNDWLAATARSATSFEENASASARSKSREEKTLMLSFGNESFSSLRKRFDVQLDVDVIESPLSGLAPDHHRRRSEAFTVEQDFARGLPGLASTISGLLVEIWRISDG